MSFTLWRGVVGMVRPTRRPGTLEELIRILPEGIGVVPLLLNFKAGSNAEFLASIPQYERFASELAEQGVDVIMLTGAPPFMLLGPEKEAALTQAWTKKFKTPVVTDPQMQVAALRAMKIKKFIGASYSALQNQIVLDYMTAAGFTALSMEPIDTPFDQVAQISVETLYAHVKRLYRQHRVRTESISRAAAGRRCVSSSFSRRTSAYLSCTRRSAKLGRSTSISTCAKPSRATAVCLPNCPSGPTPCGRLHGYCVLPSAPWSWSATLSRRMRSRRSRS